VTSEPQVLGLVVADPARTSGMTLAGLTLAEHARRALETVARPVLVGAPGVDRQTPLQRLCEGATVVVVHDALCPSVPPQVLADCLAALTPGTAVVGVRPVTDTVKRVERGVVSSTLDRDAVAELASPVVFAVADLPAVLPRLPTAGALEDLLALVDALCRAVRLVGVEVPSSGRRLHHRDDLVLLAAEGRSMR